MMKTKRIILNVITVLLMIAFIATGFGKLMQSDRFVESFTRYHIPIGLMVLIGFFELSGALGLLIPKLRLWAAAGLSAIISGNIVLHIFYGEMNQMTFPIILLFLLVVFIVLRKQLNTIKVKKHKK